MQVELILGKGDDMQEYVSSLFRRPAFNVSLSFDGLPKAMPPRAQSNAVETPFVTNVTVSISQRTLFMIGALATAEAIGQIIAGFVAAGVFIGLIGMDHISFSTVYPALAVYFLTWRRIQLLLAFQEYARQARLTDSARRNFAFGSLVGAVTFLPLTFVAGAYGVDLYLSTFGIDKAGGVFARLGLSDYMTLTTFFTLVGAIYGQYQWSKMQEAQDQIRRQLQELANRGRAVQAA